MNYRCLRSCVGTAEQDGLKWRGKPSTTGDDQWVECLTYCPTTHLHLNPGPILSHSEYIHRLCQGCKFHSDVCQRIKKLKIQMDVNLPLRNLGKIESQSSGINDMKMTRQPEHMVKNVFLIAVHHLSYYGPIFTDLSSYLNGNLLKSPFLHNGKAGCPVPFPTAPGCNGMALLPALLIRGPEPAGLSSQCS